MGSSKNNGARTNMAQLKQDQVAAAKMGLPNPEASKYASFNAKVPVTLKEYVKADANGNPSFSVEQNGATFGFGAFESQKSLAAQFDPTKAFTISKGKETPILTQGNLQFTIPNPVALTNPLDPSTLSSNAGTGSTGSTATPLARVPRNIATGTVGNVAAARALSGADTRSNKPAGVIRPLLAGY
jgi:hypothetical protein